MNEKNQTSQVRNLRTRVDVRIHIFRSKDKKRIEQGPNVHRSEVFDK